MGKRYDARKMTELCDSISHAVSNYTVRAEMLENEYSVYNSNNTYRGEAANASKEFVYKGQGKLIKEQVRVLNKLRRKFNETQDAFRDIVDSSPNAKIDMDVLEENKRFFSMQHESFEDKAMQLERLSREIRDRFDRFGYITTISYDRAKYGFEDLCGYSGFMNKCMRSFEEFDEETKAYLKNSELDRYMYDIETDTKATMNALNGMTVYNPDVKKITMTPVAQMAAKLMSTAGIQSSLNNSISSDNEIKKWAKLLKVKCSLKTVVGKDEIAQAAELTLLNCKTDKDKIVVQKCAASMMSVDTLVLQDIMQQLERWAMQLGPYGVLLMFAIIIVGVINFAAEHAGDIEQFVTPKPKEENGHIIDIPPQEDNKPIIEKPTPVPQKPSVTDIPSGDVEEKELGREIFPKTPAEEDKPKITTIQGNEDGLDYSNSDYGKLVVVSEEKMYQQGKHYNKHGRDMGYSSKKEYEQGARDFLEQNREEAEIYEGTWNDSRGSQAGQRQIIIRHDGKQLIINKETNQIIDFYEGNDLGGFKDLERVQ
ncbi:T7SS effector LXG polymorphic toxin [Butyrivibrio sp. M55]|uniref:T7SS effector LXG polymorphic toxin n=1 Tax=Butyrivibrio sp. M55 TaxID=1855323 RepID=UPI0008E7916E|nr:T7SS effector LXG polymorphic toxin [Butyrivibrio sp. M55]SFU33153.1 LXG domain of WXG superfamily protein [Butyrivibrio sp. M55]